MRAPLPRTGRSAFLVLGALVASALVALLLGAHREDAPFVRKHTIGDLEIIHSRVRVGALMKRGILRLSPGDQVITEGAGRAQVRLANGMTALLDANTELQVTAAGLELVRGRVFAESPEGSQTQVKFGTFNVSLSSSKLALERLEGADSFKLFCAQGELLVTGLGAAHRVPSGETLTLNEGKASLEPEKAFDDWTGGLAVPWGTSPLARSAIVEIGAADEASGVLAPLNVTMDRIDVDLDGEFATTRTLTRFYNGNEQAITPSIRLALPPRAILTNVTHRLSDTKNATQGQLAICASELIADVKRARLDWAGDGWIAGALPTVPAGASVELELEFGEWQTTRAGEASYRFPVGHRAAPVAIGEFQLSVDTARSGARSVAANRGAVLDGSKLVWRASDAKPNDDWVVSYAPGGVRTGVARAYVETAGDSEDPYLLVRAETPVRDPADVQLAIIVDTSRSVGASGLELSRQVADALLGNLSERDQVVVFVADETTRALGPATLSTNTPHLREQFRNELALVRPGGASDLGKALERAADALESSGTAGNRLIVYLGDGRPSLGELTADRIRAQLQRRAQGVPRLAGVAVGASADRWLLARLVAGSGPVHTVVERSEAASVAASIIAATEEATDREVKFDLGPNIDRIYPRAGRDVPSGSTTMVVGRLRGNLPASIQLSYRGAEGVRTETLRVERKNSPSRGEIARQWALQRVKEIVTSDEGLEPALLLARQHQLLLPWTEWVLAPEQSGDRVQCSAFSRRVIDLSTFNDTPYARRIEGPPSAGGGWLEPPLNYDPGQSLEEAAKSAIQAAIRAANPVFVCRDVRGRSATNSPSELSIRVEVDATGKATSVRVKPREGERADALFLGCVERIIKSLSFVGAERPISSEQSLAVPAAKNQSKTRCSLTSRLPLPLRRNVWSTRDGSFADRYETALRACELPSWVDRRELLRVLSQGKSSLQLLDAVDSLNQQGHSDAAAFLRQAALQRVETTEELRQVRNRLLRDEPNLDADIAARVRRASSNQERLAIVERALQIAPHSPLGRRLQLLLLERLENRAQLVRVIESIRNDPFTDAGLIAIAAATLGRQDQPHEAQRTFSELFERVPEDPWILGFAGDQLRAQGFAEQALSAYETLARSVPNDPATLLRIGLAQAAVGRTDIASRILDRAAQVPGRSDDARLNDLAAIVRAVVLGRARAQTVDPVEQQELTRR
ncbi:MAG: VWA domain-containing protein, partial [Myxococcales bacterium]